MAQRVKVASKQDVPQGKMREFTIQGKMIVIAESDGEYLAFDAMCTHAHCSLAGGYLDGHTLTCYCHGASFDISSGDVLAPPATAPLGVYVVTVEGDDLLIEL